MCLCWIDETGLAFGGDGGFIALWDATTQKRLVQMGGPAHVAIAGTSSRIAAGAFSRPSAAV